MAQFPSEEWLKLYVERINESKDYKEAAATWEGDISYVFEAEPDKGIPQEIWAWLDLWHGECRGAKYGVGQAEGDRAKFVIRAPYSRCKEVVNNDLDRAKGMMQGKRQLRADLRTISRYVTAANVRVQRGGTVPTASVDEKA